MYFGCVADVSLFGVNTLFDVPAVPDDTTWEASAFSAIARFSSVGSAMFVFSVISRLVMRRPGMSTTWSTSSSL